ncbi:hypothetical protein B0H67DRAFT_575283 [Lasiosphaeris hirsuta]|uniref:Uncharacterized protein n=1 Tax=Lasiosphaeris hirsuta TaxID=260670 RepID=A0AA40AQL5_9PEZI|nr:hypothetical protein B0H67DRAFT_575283 [Lasiosphaeris hirsuta]
MKPIIGDDHSCLAIGAHGTQSKARSNDFSVRGMSRSLGRRARNSDDATWMQRRNAGLERVDRSLGYGTYLAGFKTCDWLFAVCS